uniref:Putative spondins extracellular matrix n=1 Tax=Lutzomyia longipalpis TaxID=7200 RepID=A0A7G3AYU6_LUTLO
MALNPAFLKATALQQLLDEINFQRTKEMRQLLKDDSGFVVLQGTTYWTDLFVRHFLFQAEPEHSIDSDDLLFFVRKKHVKGSSRHMPKFETDVDVFRKDSRKLPIGDPDVDWEETVYLNLVIHQFDYKLTLAICTRTSPKELQVLRRHTQRVYASPSRRKMDTKGEGEEMTYPHICFMVDNFDEVFSDILVRDGEMVCVELVASDRDGSVQGVIFLGSIRYDALKKVYDARQSSLSSKVAQRMMFGLFSSGGPQTRCEFVRMKGPQGKGHAEMAVTKPKGSGVETPTSEPGFCATDMWDTDWDDENEDFYTYRHQRRLSDPSANLNHFARFAWKTKSGQDGTAGSKARSENEGLDSLANDISEIEAGDLRDDRPASSASDTKLASATSCCTCCFGSKKRWSDSASAQMSDVYCRTCDEANSPACLANVTPKRSRPKHQNLLTTFDSSRKEIKKVTESPKGHRKNNRNNVEEYELADDATSLNGDLTDDVVKIGVLSDLDPRLIVRVHGKEELPVVQQRQSELDDGAYNPLWASKGFTQTFHFWKENRRQQSTPLNAFLTYVTLPWWSIAKALLAGQVSGCRKVPPFENYSRRTRGDNGYKLIIGGEPNGYEPGKIYNLFLLGSRTHRRLQQFTHFMLSVQASSTPHLNTALFSMASPKRVGRFQLFGDHLTRFNDKCVNTVSETDDLPKTEIQVMWVAPAAGSGCVALSAMVYESLDAWFSDDGGLTKIICEGKPTRHSIAEECCACDDAKYNFIFQGIWSNETHPKDYPFAVWLTHFSDVIGATHETNFSFWGENHIATDGFKNLAEWGSVRSLETELRSKGSKLRSLIKAAGLWYPSVNTNTTSHFRVDRKHPKMSLVSMFGPSPDWVVGVNGLNLCKEDCSWMESLDIDLYPWDAGTDNGISYMRFVFNHLMSDLVVGISFDMDMSKKMDGVLHLHMVAVEEIKIILLFLRIVRDHVRL